VSETVLSLSELLHLLLQVMIPNWQPAAPLHFDLPGDAYIVDREAEVMSCVRHWLTSWDLGPRGRSLNVCCHESGCGHFSSLLSRQL